jgi:hypothetical protein
MSVSHAKQDCETGNDVTDENGSCQKEAEEEIVDEGDIDEYLNTLEQVPVL